MHARIIYSYSKIGYLQFFKGALTTLAGQQVDQNVEMFKKVIREVTFFSVSLSDILLGRLSPVIAICPV